MFPLTPLPAGMPWIVLNLPEVTGAGRAAVLGSRVAG